MAKYKYSSQLEFKQNEVINNLKRIGGIELPIHEKILACKNQYFYRNKMEFSFSNKRWLTIEEIHSEEEILKKILGFNVPGMFDKIINLNNCYLQKNPSNSIRLSVKQFNIDKNGLSYFDIRNHEGLLRNLMIRTTSSEDLMVLVQFYENDKENIQLLMEHLKTTFPEITSLLYIVNQKAETILSMTKKLFVTMEKIILLKK